MTDAYVFCAARMEEWDNLVVRFHFGGSFFTTRGKIKYVGGETALSSIEFDKLFIT
jgi:hypothetical protein